jgi:hypothetical protein
MCHFKVRLLVITALLVLLGIQILAQTNEGWLVDCTVVLAFLNAMAVVLIHNSTIKNGKSQQVRNIEEFKNF